MSCNDDDKYIVQSVVHAFSLRLHNHLHTGYALCYRKNSAPLAWYFDQQDRRHVVALPPMSSAEQH